MARAEIRDPSGEDLLTTHNAPQVGVTYTVVLLDENDVDITASFPPETLHWALDGANTVGVAACAVTLDNHDTGVTGTTFTPRPNASSNSGVDCGDQGFGLKVNY
ncbi:hypothetical protein OQA87_22820 [Yersinia intermedia]|uniref:hypothetical protein n=1 Tax=Yersinia intermedia TaxID=631 RepID=UPI00224423E5|nr:hypothetical protein [Yersinia intermedia]MCW8114359.1 hypothetical protein [Yersinia intermedia]